MQDAQAGCAQPSVTVLGQRTLHPVALVRAHAIANLARVEEEILTAEEQKSKLQFLKKS